MTMALLLHYAINTPKASNLRRANRHAPGVQRAIYWTSGEIQKASISLLCRKKVAEPSARRLWDCYAKQFFHPNAPTCHSGVFAFVILKGAGLNPVVFGVFTAIMNSAETLRTRSAELIIAVNTPKALGLSPAPFKMTKAKTPEWQVGAFGWKNCLA